MEENTLISIGNNYWINLSYIIALRMRYPDIWSLLLSTGQELILTNDEALKVKEGLGL